MPRSTHHPGYGVFLQLLRAERKTHGVTQAQLASTLENRQTFVSKIENGERRLDVVEVMEYLKAIGADPREFFAKLHRELGHDQVRGKLAIRKRPRTATRKQARRKV